MKKKRGALILVLSLFMGLCIFSSPLLLAYEEEEEYLIPTLVKKKIGDLRLDLSTSILYGFNSNLYLARYDEDSTCFMQEALGIYGTYPISEMYTLRGGYDLTCIKYFSESEPDLADNILSLGLDTKIDENFLLSVDYLVDFVGFPHDQFSKYTMNQIGTSLRHTLTDWFYHKIGYDFSYKRYPKWKTRDMQGQARLGKREDARNTVWHEGGLYLGDRTLVKSKNRFYYNDSNEGFLRYYDYKAFRTGAEVNHLITDKLYGMGSFAYERKIFDKRGVSDSDKDQRDNTFMYGASLFYDVTKNISVGVNFDYTDNDSKENMESYEDYVVTSGVYCSF